ncbi:MAG: MATE family efflux transporter [Rikenellaceae bacterium]
MHSQIIKLSIPNIISNITVPLLGMVDMMIVGHLGSEVMIGAMALGAAIFNFIYWSFAFLRMGTSGFTAQAYGARDMREMSSSLLRSLAVALAVGLTLVVFQYPLGKMMLWIMDGSNEVTAFASSYFFARIWAAPATLSLNAIQGWYIGMQNSRLPMYMSIVINILNIGFSLFFVFVLDMGFVGIAWGTVVAQYGGLLMGVILWLVHYKRMSKYFDLGHAMKLSAMLRFFNVNRDIFIRTACIVTVFTFFTSLSARQGDMLLAVNMLLMQLFTLFSYVIDGFAYSAESLIGKFEGAGNMPAIKKCLRQLFMWGFGLAMIFVAVYVVFWQELLGLFTDSTQVIEMARGYIGWIIAVPLITFIPFVIDGALIGATKNVIMRKTVFFSAIMFFVVFYLCQPFMGNDALWLAFMAFMVSRGLSQYVMLRPLGWF